MNDLAELLHTAMTEHSEGLALRPDAARTALDSAARSRRVHVVLGAGATAVLVGGTAAAVTLLDAQSPAGSARSKISVLDSGHATPQPDTPATLVHPKVTRGSDGPGPDVALRTVSLPDPAPGFPVQRAEATVARTVLPNGTYWTDAFLVAANPPTCTTVQLQPTSNPPGGRPETPTGTSCTPNGAEATVLVTEGAEPTAPDSNDEIEGVPVTQTVSVNGQPGYVTESSSQTELYYGDGQFAIQVSGEDTTVADLVTLAESLHGLPWNAPG
jgi:hypothetical protein